MSILQKTTKFDLKLNKIGLGPRPGYIYTEEGELLDLWKDLELAYGDKLFNLTTSLTETEKIDLGQDSDDEC